MERKGYNEVLQALNRLLVEQKPPTSVSHDLSKYLSKAALFYVICKSNYGGLLRYNLDGTIRPQYSVQQYGTGSVNVERLQDIHKKLKGLNITFRIGDYTNALLDAKRGDFVNLDPPYYRDKTSKYHHVHDV